MRHYDPDSRPPCPQSNLPVHFHRDSAVQRVARAVSQGARITEEIARRAGVSVMHAQTCLTRLKHKGWVRSINVKLGQSGRRCMYEPAGAKILLADIWR